MSCLDLLRDTLSISLRIHQLFDTTDFGVLTSLRSLEKIPCKDCTMTYARKSLISLQDTPYYHVITRCVRRAWLWGFDEYARKDYSHRKMWVLERLTVLSNVFGIEICAFAVMSNHLHLVLYVDQHRAKAWSQREVIDRWESFFSKPLMVERWQRGVATDAEAEIVESMIELWRHRLYDISWYMRCLNEYLARRANAEDQCTGRFWQGRFKSQALLDEAGLLTAMAYVDLNPVRAGIAETPEASEFTSIYERIRELRVRSDCRGEDAVSANSSAMKVPLMKFQDADNCAASGIPFLTVDYFELLDWTGRALRGDKSGSIDASAPPILRQMNIDVGVWPVAMRPSGNIFGRALGRLGHMQLHAKTLGQSWVRGLHLSRSLYAHRLTDVSG